MCALAVAREVIALEHVYPSIRSIGWRALLRALMKIFGATNCAVIIIAGDYSAATDSWLTSVASLPFWVWVGIVLGVLAQESGHIVTLLVNMWRSYRLPAANELGVARWAEVQGTPYQRHPDPLAFDMTAEQMANVAVLFKQYEVLQAMHAAVQSASVMVMLESEGDAPLWQAVQTHMADTPGLQQLFADRRIAASIALQKTKRWRLFRQNLGNAVRYAADCLGLALASTGAFCKEKDPTFQQAWDAIPKKAWLSMGGAFVGLTANAWQT